MAQVDAPTHAAETGPPRTQTGHSLAIETPLGKDVLLLTALDGTETISRGFTYSIEMLTRAPDSDVRSLIGKPVTLWLRNNSAMERRPLHGHIRQLTRIAIDSQGYRRWRAEVAPWLWFLTHSVDCQIYQNLSIPEILRSVFDDHGLTDYELRLHGQYPKLNFCVQYRESAFAFVSRLMEHVGIFYAFEHHPDRHLLVLGDYSIHAKFTTPQEVSFNANAQHGEIQEFEHSYAFRAGNWALSDFDFEFPNKNLHTREATVLDINPMKRFEIYDYPGHYQERDKGADLTRLRVEQEEAQHHRVCGSGWCVGFDPGKRFVLAPDRDDRAAKQEAYFLTEVRHIANEPSYFANSEEAASYSNRFVAIPAKMPFRPERRTPKPIVQGPQTATVVGPAGESIHTDQYGRVRLLFHWDRRGKRDEHASCWIRVSQLSAGSYWGSLAIPHVGHEVIVAFLEGDPDRPIVTGHVHNGTNMPPIPLPEHNNKTIMRDHGDNKIVMHGKAGKQYMSLVSPRSLNMVAVRSTAKSLSAATQFVSKNGKINDSVDGFEDPESLTELYNIFQTLEYGTPDANVSAAANILPAQDGTADSGASIDINAISEGNINGLSLKNTNAWVYGDSNSWVHQDANAKILGNSNSEVDGDANLTVLGNNLTAVTHTNRTTADNNYTQATNNYTFTNLNVTTADANFTMAFANITAYLGTNITLGLGLNLLFAPGMNMQFCGFNISNNGFNVSTNSIKVHTTDGVELKDAGLSVLTTLLHLIA